MHHPNDVTRDVTPAEQAKRRRLSAVAAGLVLVVAATLGVAAGPASAAAPGAPRAIGAVAYSSGIHLYFAPPADDGGKPITLYTVYRVPNDGGIHIPDTFTAPDSRVIVDSTAVAGTQYSYVVKATNADGEGAGSTAILATRPAAATTDFSKFDSIPDFITRQYHDFLGRAPTAGEVGSGQTTLTATPDPVGPYLIPLATDASRKSRLAVVRLYFAYFKRGPDHGGLTYWTAQIATGKKNLNDVSNSFARSNEFKTTYGSLSNVDFVTLVYQNVLGRDPEPSGFAFWTNQLDMKLVIRGRVMTQFSESNEFKNTSKGEVQASDAWDAMTGKNIPVATLALMAAHIEGGGNVGDVGQYIINQPVYVVPDA